MPNDPEHKFPPSGGPDRIGKPPPLTEDFDAWRLTGGQLSTSSKIEAEPYDPRPQEDQARRNIAYCLIGLLFLLCLGTFATVWWTVIPVEDTLKVVQILLGPVIALVSAATGFYYGTKSK
jgi:hypothetical protein